ncbi:membrane protein [Candidatus Magnetoovum chiemensis]|nr:membrane protein [Candidatus Magnetoovum chiemensis]
MKEKHDSEDEIDIANLFLHIWRRKYVILTMIALSAVTSYAYLSKQPVLYKSKAAINPGIISIINNNYNYIDKPLNIIAVIQSGTLDIKIAKSLELHNETSLPFKFKLTNTNGTNIINIDYLTKDLLLGKKIITELISQLDAYYKPTVDLQRTVLKKDISILNNKISQIQKDKEIKNRSTMLFESGIDTLGKDIIDINNSIEKIKAEVSTIENHKETIKKDIALNENILNKNLNEIEKKKNRKEVILSIINSTKRSIALLKERQKELEEQIAPFNEQSEELSKLKDNQQQQKIEQDPASSLLYLNTRQQNMSIRNSLMKDIKDNKKEQETLTNKIEANEIGLKNVDIEINTLNIINDDNAKAKEKLELKIKNTDIRIERKLIHIKDLENEIEKQNIKIKDAAILIENSKIETSKLDIDINNIENELIEKQRLKDMLSAIEIIQEPYSIDQPVKRKTIQIVLVSSMAALFFTIALIFIIEAIKRSKDKDDAND